MVKEREEDELPIVWDEHSKLHETILGILEAKEKDLETFTLANTQHWSGLGYILSSTRNWVEMLGIQDP